MKFREFLTQHRQFSGFSKKELADKAGVSLAYISDMEHGRKKPPPIELLEKLAQALRLSPAQKDQLFDAAFKERNVKELTKFRRYSVKDSASEVEYSPAMVRVPVLGTCPASPKQWVADEVECYESISKTFIGDRRMYILRILGDSMNRAGIDDGCMVLVDADRVPKNGEIVVIRVDHETTVKRFFKSDHQVTLVPDSTNPKHQPVIFTKENTIQIRGVVDSIYLKKLR